MPIIFISPASDDMNLVMAVNPGADDFLARPFKLKVALTKVQTPLRRTCIFNEQKTVPRASTIVLSIGNGSLTSDSGKPDLTESKLRIIKRLMEQRGRVVSRNSIIRYLQENEHFIDDNTLTVNMTCLHKKLESIGLKGLIETKKELGYLLSEAEIRNEVAAG